MHRQTLEMNLASERSVAGVEAAAVCCDRCPGATTADTSHFARRRLLKAAVFQPQPGPASVAGTGPADSIGASAAAPTADGSSADRHVYRTVTGTITDISPHFITILESNSERLLVAECAKRPPQVVVISPLARVRIKVRVPNLRPGYLIDIIGVRRRGVLHGLIATSPQPPYRSDHLPPHAQIGGRLPEAI